MAIPFTRSMRALQADSHLVTLIGLSAALVLLGLWAAWFFFAQIALYTTGQIVTTTREGTIMAAFPASARDTIRRGQRVHLHPQGGNPAEPGKPLVAVVTEVTQPTSTDQVQVEMFVLEHATARRLLQNGLRSAVEIPVEHVTPATLVMRHWARP